ncbi:hypothetical protein Hamer_G008767 [Homarus americanus]|uniref:Uncharacterized protein n=1 Tax=Homarus americanus TaxID=6706 RepID=A0A8J5MNN2_HOMAM|nr:hypothetical protein Hamer_G008767 [Homarus americanus]
MLLFQKFTSDVRHIIGQDNGLANILSRSIDVVLPQHPSPDYHQIAEAQRADEELSTLRTITHLCPATPRRPQPLHTHVSGGLLHVEQVFVRRDAVSPPLTRPYNGPFRVLVRTPKRFTIGRLKPTYVDLEPCLLQHAQTRLSHQVTPTPPNHVPQFTPTVIHIPPAPETELTNPPSSTRDTNLPNPPGDEFSRRHAVTFWPCCRPTGPLHVGGLPWPECRGGLKGFPCQVAPLQGGMLRLCAAMVVR